MASRKENLLERYLGDKVTQEFPPVREMTKKPHRHWQNWKNIEKELKKLILELGHFPSQKELIKYGYNGMLDGIHEYHGGVISVREKMGHELKTVEPNKWKSLDYVIEQARKAIKESDIEILSSQKRLCEMGYSSLSCAISKYFGGFPNFREILGEADENKKYDNIDFVLKRAREVMEEHRLNTLPCGNKLRELGYVTLAISIDKRHGGYRKFRRLLGEKQKKLPNGKLDDIEFIAKEIKKIMKERKLDIIPSTYQLRSWGYQSISFAINRYHRGMVSFREFMGEDQIRVKNCSWKSLEYALVRAKEILNENSLEELPGHNRLIRLKGGPSLGMSIQKYHGGYSRFREVLRQYLGRPSDEQQLEGVLETYVGGRK